jgi:hypothetical protein
MIHLHLRSFTQILTEQIECITLGSLRTQSSCTAHMSIGHRLKRTTDSATVPHPEHVHLQQH